MSDDFKNQLWNKIIRQKIDNSSRNLAVLGLEGVKEIESYIPKVQDGDKDNIELNDLPFSEGDTTYHEEINWSKVLGVAICLVGLYFINRKWEFSMFRQMRRFKQQITDAECKEILKNEKRRVLSLLGDDGYPYGLPRSHFYSEEDNKIYFHGAKEGHKIDAIKNYDKASW